MLICGAAMEFFCTAMSWVFGGQAGFVSRLVDKFAVVLFTCTFALVGAAVGAITGAIKGQTTETGLIRGFGVGAVAGAITAIQLLDLIANREPFSKVGLIYSLVNGKVFMEWVAPAMLKAYQWEISSTDMSLRETSDIFEVNTFMGLSQETIDELPMYMFSNAKISTPCSETSCAICLQDLEDGDFARLLPSCQHFFHLHCIDEWLTRQGTCPKCRKGVMPL